VARRPHQDFAVFDSPVTQPAPGRSVAANLLYSLRPGQWTKNLFVFAGLLFSRHLFDPVAVARSVGAFVIFCALSGVVYLVNDVADRESDARHPVKARRPIASGAISPRFALGVAGGLGAVGLAAAFALDFQFGLVAAAYLALQGLYSGPFKHIVIIDVLSIAIGFVLRVVAGAVVIGVPTSYWLLVCTILLALFLALSKRRHELVLLADGAAGHRRILQEYSPYLLDQMIGVVTASTLMAYIIYATSAETAEKFGTSLLGLTIPFPLYGIFRYLYLVHQKEGGGSPSEMLLNDRPLLACVGLWGLAVAIIIYRPFGMLGI
jgi:4-hydroxybenzoate polyprenyltransferase